MTLTQDIVKFFVMRISLPRASLKRSSVWQTDAHDAASVSKQSLHQKTINQFPAKTHCMQVWTMAFVYLPKRVL